jgi:hypothetical protein
LFVLKRSDLVKSLSEANIFDEFIKRCQLYYDRPAHSISEIKDNDGDDIIATLV